MGVLGISVSSRMVGLAIMRNEELVDFHARLYKERWGNLKANIIMANLRQCIKTHSITHIALAVPYAHYQSKEAKALHTRIKTFCKEKSLTLCTYQATAFHQLHPQRKAKKKALMQSLAEQYPELRYVYRREANNKNRYYHKLFEAVASALLCSRSLHN